MRQIAVVWGTGILYDVTSILKLTTETGVDLGIFATNFIYNLTLTIGLQLKNLSKIQIHLPQIKTGLPDISLPVNQILEVTDEMPSELIPTHSHSTALKCPTIYPNYCKPGSVFRTTTGRGNVSPCVRDPDDCNKPYEQVQLAIHNVIYPVWSKKCTSKKSAMGDNCMKMIDISYITQ